MHTMNLINEHEGTEEWLCSTCGRHLLVRWNPKFKRTVILEGDSTAMHSGLKGDMLTMNKVDVAVEESSPSETQDESMDDNRLTPWLTWIDESHFETLWDEDGR